MFGLAVIWVAPGSLWRPVALALLLQWGLIEGSYQITLNQFPDELSRITDIMVIATVLCSRFAPQVKFVQPHWSDWLIILLYPVVWWLYEQSDTRDKWIALYWIVIVQFLIAGPWPQIQRALSANSHGPFRCPQEA